MPIRKPLEPIRLAEALRIVNDNVAKINATLRAAGSVDGHVTLPTGQVRSYHADATLFFLAPGHVRFDVKALGQRQFLFGSNDEYSWCYSGRERAYECRRRGEGAVIAPELPVRPEEMLDLLGLRAISPESAVQRVVDEFQQVLFLAVEREGGVLLQKEYWLDRYPPRLVRRVLFRDSDGVVTMESRLDDYVPVADDGPLVPQRITTEWPMAGARMDFRVARWTFVEGVTGDSIQFATPRECAQP